MVSLSGATNKGNTEMEILRHHYKTSNGNNFFLKSDEVDDFKRCNNGHSYHGFVDVPDDCRPPFLRRGDN